MQVFPFLAQDVSVKITRHSRLDTFCVRKVYLQIFKH